MSRRYYLVEPFGVDDRQSNRRARVLLGAAFAVLAGALFWPRGNVGPRLIWRVEGHASPGAIASVDPATPFDVELELDAPAHVYVVSDDLTRGTIAHFPSKWLRSDVTGSPLPAGTAVLPGSADGRTLRWHSGDFSGPVAVAVIVSASRLDSLESALTQCRQMGNAAFPKRDVLDAYAPANPQLAVAGSAPSPDGTPTPRWTKRAELPLLERVFAMTEQRSCGAMYRLDDGLYAAVLRFDNQWPDGPQAPGISDQVRSSLGGLMGTMPSPPSAPEGR